MDNVNKDLRDKLERHFVIDWGQTTADTISADGTRKLLINFGGSEVECTFFDPSCLSRCADMFRPM